MMQHLPFSGVCQGKVFIIAIYDVSVSSFTSVRWVVSLDTELIRACVVPGYPSVEDKAWLVMNGPVTVGSVNGSVTIGSVNGSVTIGSVNGWDRLLKYASVDGLETGSDTGRLCCVPVLWSNPSKTCNTY